MTRNNSSRVLASLLLAAAVLSILWLPQARSQTTAIINNDRVIAWRGSSPPGKLAYETVTVSADGRVRYSTQGEAAVAGALVIGLKPTTVAPLPNPTKFPLAMDRPGAQQVLDNGRVTVWDYRWTPGVPTPMHFHDKDVVVMFLEDGDLKSTTQKGEVTLNQYKAGAIRFNARDRVHTEELVRGTQRAIIVELK